MAGARTAVVVVVAGTKAAADWMEKIAAASGRESLERVIFFEAWMKLVSVRSGGTDVIVKVRRLVWTEEGTLNVVGVVR